MQNIKIEMLTSPIIIHFKNINIQNCIHILLSFQDKTDDVKKAKKEENGANSEEELDEEEEEGTEEEEDTGEEEIPEGDDEEIEGEGNYCNLSEFNFT